MDSQGDLRLHWRANGDGGKAEKSYMGPILTPGGEAEQVQTLQLTTSKQLFQMKCEMTQIFHLINHRVAVD